MNVAGHHLSEVEDYLADRIRQPYPTDCHVLAGSTPIVSFGDVRTAWVATLGINPSDSEFVQKARWLDGDRRRFESLSSLGLDRPEDANDEQVTRILEACYGYFDGPNPYWTWFKALERVLTEALGASYRDASAAHLDLIQWATTPVWGKISDRRVRRTLIESDREFLRRQLDSEGVRLVLMNGRRVMDEVQKMGVDLTPVHIPSTDGKRFEILRGHLGDTGFLGWNLAYPNGGISAARTEVIIDTVRELGLQLAPGSGLAGPSALSIPRDTVVTSKSALAALLGNWMDSGEATIGDIGSFGGRAWIRIDLPGGQVVVNADTKRSAVHAFLEAVATHGPETPWPVVANRGGTVNKVLFRADGVATPGWYAYTANPMPPGTVL